MGRAPRAFVGTITSVLRGTHLVKIPLSSYVLYAYPGPNHTHDNIPMGWLVCRRESNRILMRILRFGLCALSRTPNRRHHRASRKTKGARTATQHTHWQHKPNRPPRRRSVLIIPGSRAPFFSKAPTFHSYHSDQYANTSLSRQKFGPTFTPDLHSACGPH